MHRRPGDPGCKKIFFSIVVCFSVFCQVQAQKELEVVKSWIHYSDAPNSLYHYIAGQAYGYLDRRAETVGRINTAAGWQERQKWLKTTIAQAVGTFPAKTPLNAKLLRTVDKEGYKIEHIVFESQPGYYVTSSLFLPKTAVSNKAPAIIYCSGHSSTGYRSYQNVILNLVKKGFVVFAFDPAGQGERLQYLNEQTGKSSFRWPAWEHSYAGAQLFMTGNTLARNFTWDGIRAIDYLVTRPEVDTSRIGITGRSGGGTQSAYIAAMDERIKAVAPENYITNFKRLFQTIGPQDAEQDFLYGIQKGLDIADLLAVRAPKPALLIATTQDMFPIQGAMETAAEVSRIYKAFGRAANFAMVSDDAPHASTKKNREAMYAFFQKSLANPGSAKDEETVPLTQEELRVTETGQVSTALKSETIYSLNYLDAGKRMQQLEAARKQYPARFPQVIAAAKKLSGYAEPRISSPLFAGRFQKQGYAIEKYALEGEGGYPIPYLLFKPEIPTGKALVYLHPSGKFGDTASDGTIAWLVKQGITVLSPDIVGTGEMGPGSFKGDSYIDSVAFNTWFASVLIGRSIVGIQAADIVRLGRVLKNNASIKEVYGLAHKQMAPSLLHAAAFDKVFSAVALIEPYSSYRSMVMNPQYQEQFLFSTVPASIGEYDLPDLAASLAPRKLLVAGMTDGNGSSEQPADIEKDMKVIRGAYDASKNARFETLPAGAEADWRQYLEAWLK
ncbi:MAG TPA: acetylxylan esterase [Flavisolibacter sp.]|nr:acetylxylan esterase [Flavisolibacter sp.]